MGHSAGETKTFAADDNAYILTEGSAGLAFYRAVIGTTLQADKAYLRLPEAVAESTLRLCLDGTPSGIESVATNNADAPLYDISGRRVAHPAKGGVYIRQGRKIVF